MHIRIICTAANYRTDWLKTQYVLIFQFDATKTEIGLKQGSGERQFYMEILKTCQTKGVY